MKVFRILSLALASVLSLAVFFPAQLVQAHENHDHAPGMEAPNGGIVKEGKTMNLELVTEGHTIRLFPLGKNGKPIAAKTVRLVATAKPAKKSLVKIELRPGATEFGVEGNLDAQGAHRVEVKIEAELSGKKESFLFQVEPEG